MVKKIRCRKWNRRGVDVIDDGVRARARDRVTVTGHILYLEQFTRTSIHFRKLLFAMRILALV